MLTLCNAIKKEKNTALDIIIVTPFLLFCEVPACYKGISAFQE